jgi:exopolysaccharide production protein ExoZ
MAGDNNADRAIALPSLQAGRAVAAMGVVLFHADGILVLPKYGGTTAIHRWAFVGALGVDFFFILSGFIILHAHIADVGQPGRLLRYVWRRAARVYPIYWIYLTVVIAAMAVMGRQFGIGELASNYSLLGHAPEFSIISPAWSLYHEVLFYTLFAAAILDIRAGIVVGALWLAAILIFPGGQNDTLVSQLNLTFFLGMAMRLVAFRIPARFYLWPLAAGAVTFATVMYLFHRLGGDVPLFRGMTQIAGGLIILGMAMADSIGAFRIPRGVLFLGAASYSIYLTHLASLSVLARLVHWSAQPPVLAVTALTIISMGAGAALYALIERPILKRLR